MKSVNNQLYFKSLKRIRKPKCNQRTWEDRKGDQVTNAQEQVEWENTRVLETMGRERLEK